MKLDDVLDALRVGKRFQAGAGRYYKTYFIEHMRLRCEIFDEGHIDVFDATEDALADDIRRHPDGLR